MARFAPRPCLHIGITGGIGSGKSTAAAILQAATDASLIDADQLARASTRADGAAMAQIRATFGDAVIAADGSMRRDVMRAWAFRDPAVKRTLEAIIHPIVLQQAQALATTAERQGKNLILYELPLLVESAHWRKRLHRVIVVDCDEPTQIQRVMQRSGLEHATASLMIAAQASRQQRRQAADAVIYNGASVNLQQLQTQVDALAASFSLMIAPKELPSDPVRIPLQ